jgi:uncharacterized protein (DUF58 family)
VLGMTRVAVASHACANLRVLPRLRALAFQKEPRNLSKAEGALTRLSRLATDDHFRTREYLHGDDLRRVHWKQSVNTGKLIVRVPESVPYAPQKVRLVLDTFLPPTWAFGRAMLEDALDMTVETWIAMAHAFVRRGERVELLLWTDGAPRALTCKRGEERMWRSLGADAAWQSDSDAVKLLEQSAEHNTSAIIVTSGFSSLTPLANAKASVVLTDAVSFLEAARNAKTEGGSWIQYRYPAGAEDNGFDWKGAFAAKPDTPRLVRAVTAARDGTLGLRAQGLDVVMARFKGASVALERAS